MSLRHLVPTLAALAAIPAAAAVEIANADDIKVDLGVRIQSRIEFISASDAAGEDYDIWEHATTEDPQSMNFMFRRARAWLQGSYKDATKFNLTFSGDKTGSVDDGSGTVPWDVLYAWISHTVSQDDMSHTVRFGKYVPEFASGAYVSTGALLLPTTRFTAGLSVPGNNLTLAYCLDTKYARIEAGLVEDDANGSDNGDIWFYVHAESAILPDYKPAKRLESYLGAEGMEWLAGLGVAVRSDGDDDDDGQTVIQADYLFHYNEISALVGFAHRTTEQPAGADDLTAMVIEVQGAYAFKLENGMVIEPCARFSLVDTDTDDDDQTAPYQDEGGASGTYIDLGVNAYFAGHTHKAQLGVTIFSPEEGEADATIVRLQHQLSF